MGNISLKRRLKTLIFPIVSIGILIGTYLEFYHSNNWTHQVRDKERYYFQVGKTKGLFTQRIFTKCNLENSPREAYHEESIFGGSKFYADEPSDGLVDEITLFGPFSDKPSLDLIRARDYDKFKLEFDRANKDFAKNRNGFVKDMQKYEFN